METPTRTEQKGFARFLGVIERYEKKAGIRTVVATMLPYTFVFLAIWMVLLIVWLVFGLPLGPGAPMFIDPASFGN